MSMFVDYTDVVPQNIGCTSPEEKQVPKQPSKYHQVTLNYNFGTEKEPMLDNFLLQLPPVRSTGITEKDELDGRKSYSMYVPLTLNDDKVRLFLQKFQECYKRTAELLGSVKTQVKMFKFDPNNPGEGMHIYRHPIYWPIDKTTGEVINGKNPSMYLKLVKRGSGIYEEKTLFTGLNQQEISWDYLINVDMVFIPLVHVEKLYIGAGGKATLQLKVVSAVVKEIYARNTVSKQMATIDQLISSDSSAVSKFEEQLNKLYAQRNGLTSSSTHHPPTTSSQSQQPAVTSSLASFMQAQNSVSDSGDESSVPQTSPVPPVLSTPSLLQQLGTPQMSTISLPGQPKFTPITAKLS